MSRDRIFFFDKMLIVGCLAAIIILALIGIDIHQKKNQLIGLNESEILKSSKENIVDYKIKKIVDPNATGSGGHDIVLYHYVSTIEVPTENYNGFNEDISKRTENSQSFLKSITPVDDKTQREEYVGKFYSAAAFKKNGDKWFQIESATTTPTAFVAQTRLTLLDHVKEFFGQKVLADTFAPGAGEGFITNNVGDTSNWTAVHDALTGTSADTTGTGIYTGGGYSCFFSCQRFMYRAFLPFDTSSISDSATITAAALNLDPSVVVLRDTSTYGFVTVVQTTQALATALSTADYDQCGAVSNPTEGVDTGNRVYGTSITQDVYITLTFNATGISWISKTGYSLLGVREGHDALNVDPGGSLPSDIGFYSSDYSGTSNDPYLTVTYSLIAPTAVKIDGGTLKIDGGTLKIN